MGREKDSVKKYLLKDNNAYLKHTLLYLGIIGMLIIITTADIITPPLNQYGQFSQVFMFGNYL